MGNNTDKKIMQQMETNKGKVLFDISFEHPILLIFLRHFGCTFCRQALKEISELRERIEQKGTKIIFVHMSDKETAKEYFKKYKIDHPIHISDPICRYYAAFGLKKGNLTQLFGLSTWIRGFRAGVIDGHGLGKQLGDSFQMPGVFGIYKGEIKNKYIHKVASDRPDYEQLAEECIHEAYTPIQKI